MQNGVVLTKPTMLMQTWSDSRYGWQWRDHVASLGLGTDDMLKWIEDGHLFDLAKSIDHQRAVELNAKTSGGFVHFESPVRMQRSYVLDGTFGKMGGLDVDLEVARTQAWNEYFELQTKLPAPWGKQAVIAAVNINKANQSPYGVKLTLMQMLSSIDVVRQVEIRQAGGLTHTFHKNGVVEMPEHLEVGVPVEVTYQHEIPRKRRDKGKGRNKRRGRS